MTRKHMAIAAAALLLGGCSYFLKTKDRDSTAPLFYSDLGPDEIDVSGYPEGQRRNYGVFRRTCSQCHTLARAINVPTVSRGFWEFYLLSMRARSRYTPDTEISKDDAQAILDFLDFDSNERKVARRAEFELKTRELKSRFDQVLREKVGRLQGSDQPKLIGSEGKP
jgi:hypothetical protein